jgi:hypothetical protein
MTKLPAGIATISGQSAHSRNSRSIAAWPQAARAATSKDVIKAIARA